MKNPGSHCVAIVNPSQLDESCAFVYIRAMTRINKPMKSNTVGKYQVGSLMTDDQIDTAIKMHEGNFSSQGQ